MGFRDLRRYESQKAAYDAYKAWQALTPDLKQAAFAAITDETKRAYLKPDVDTYSAPFGQSVGDQDYAAALVILVPLANTWMEAATAPAKRSYKFTPEGA